MVGNDTDDSGAGGLHTFGLDGDAIVPGQTLDVASPTYLAQHDDLLFAVSESSPSRVHSFRLDRGTFPATLTRISSAEIRRDGACHLAVAPDGRHVLTACYGSGSVTVHEVLPGGTLTDAIGIVDFEGSGPATDRQEASHTHQVVFDGDVVLVPDLGSDAIRRFRLGQDGALAPLPGIPMPPGFGPRHLVVQADRLFVVGELSGRIWAGRRSGEGFTGSGIVEASASVGQFPAAVKVSGDRLFVSLRGRDTIAEFALDHQVPELVREFPVGRWPRDFVIDGRHMWVGHQRGGEVACYALEAPVPASLAGVRSPSPAGLLLLD